MAMQTRKNPRKDITLPGRYFTGLGQPVDVILKDLSTGGCRFEHGSDKLRIGFRLQIYIAGSGPHHAMIRWVENGEVGLTFIQPLSEEEYDAFQPGHVPDVAEVTAPGEFEEMPEYTPRRFC